MFNYRSAFQSIWIQTTGSLGVQRGLGRKMKYLLQLRTEPTGIVHVVKLKTGANDFQQG
jgi:hypothetical protein